MRGAERVWGQILLLHEKKGYWRWLFGSKIAMSERVLGQILLLHEESVHQPAADVTAVIVCAV